MRQLLPVVLQSIPLMIYANILVFSVLSFPIWIFSRRLNTVQSKKMHWYFGISAFILILALGQMIWSATKMNITGTLQVYLAAFTYGFPFLMLPLMTIKPLFIFEFLPTLLIALAYLTDAEERKNSSRWGYALILFGIWFFIKFIISSSNLLLAIPLVFVGTFGILSGIGIVKRASWSRKMLWVFTLCYLEVLIWMKTMQLAWYGDIAGLIILIPSAFIVFQIGVFLSQIVPIAWLIWLQIEKEHSSPSFIERKIRFVTAAIPYLSLLVAIFFVVLTAVGFCSMFGLYFPSRSLLLYKFLRLLPFLIFVISLSLAFALKFLPLNSKKDYFLLTVIFILMSILTIPPQAIQRYVSIPIVFQVQLFLQFALACFSIFWAFYALGFLRKKS